METDDVIKSCWFSQHEKTMTEQGELSLKLTSKHAERLLL